MWVHAAMWAAVLSCSEAGCPVGSGSDSEFAHHGGNEWELASFPEVQSLVISEHSHIVFEGILNK